MRAATGLAWVVTLGLSAGAAWAQGGVRGREVRVFRWESLGRGYLGVQVTPLTPELRVHFGAPEDSGVMVSRVEEGGPAESAGIRVGDILTAIDGERIEHEGRLARAVQRKEQGETVTIELYRDGALESYPVTVGQRERPVLDLAGGYLHAPGDAPRFDFYITPPGLHLDERSMEAFEGAMRELEDRFDSDEWRQRMEKLKSLDLSGIEDRMREVEKRLKELERELEEERARKF